MLCENLCSNYYNKTVQILKKIFLESVQSVIRRLDYKFLTQVQHLQLSTITANQSIYNLDQSKSNVQMHTSISNLSKNCIVISSYRSFTCIYVIPHPILRPVHVTWTSAIRQYHLDPFSEDLLLWELAFPQLSASVPSYSVCVGFFGWRFILSAIPSWINKNWFNGTVREHKLACDLASDCLRE